MSRQRREALDEIKRQMALNGIEINRANIINFVAHRIYDFDKGYWKTVNFDYGKGTKALE